MTIEDAEKIYNNPKGHSREELIECLQVLNNQEVVLTHLQYLAIKDAHDRLECSVLDLLVVGGSQTAKE